MASKLDRAKAVSRTFSRLLRQELGRELLLVVVRQNNAEGNGGVCHTHDVCDANVVMDEALTQHGLTLDSHTEEYLHDVWEAAWDLAKARDFYIHEDAESDDDSQAEYIDVLRVFKVEN